MSFLSSRQLISIVCGGNQARHEFTEPTFVGARARKIHRLPHGAQGEFRLLWRPAAIAAFQSFQRSQSAGKNKSHVIAETYLKTMQHATRSHQRPSLTCRENQPMLASSKNVDRNRLFCCRPVHSHPEQSLRLTFTLAQPTSDRDTTKSEGTDSSTNTPHHHLVRHIN